MKRYVLTPAAKQDRRDEVRYYRKEAGAKVVNKLIAALQHALHELELNPGIGSPALGRELGIEGLRTWRLERFPLTLWYFERVDHVVIVRVVGQRQDAEGIEVDGGSHSDKRFA